MKRLPRWSAWVVTRVLAVVLMVAGQSMMTAAAATLALTGRMGERALLMIEGQAKVLAVGQSYAGVKLLAWQGDQALVEHNGTRVLLRVGATPVALAGGTQPVSSGREIVLSAGPGGHFITGGAINGQAVQFMVDTGATMVAMSQRDAQRLGLDLRSARISMAQTANGPVPVQQVSLTRVRVAGVEISNVDAIVLPAAMPHVLLGNSFLTRFQMRRDNDVMRLQLR